MIEPMTFEDLGIKLFAQPQLMVVWDTPNRGPWYAWVFGQVQDTYMSKGFGSFENSPFEHCREEIYFWKYAKKI
jgi:hypothetical protein